MVSSIPETIMISKHRINRSSTPFLISKISQPIAVPARQKVYCSVISCFSQLNLSQMPSQWYWLSPQMFWRLSFYLVHETDLKLHPRTLHETSGRTVHKQSSETEFNHRQDDTTTSRNRIYLLKHPKDRICILLCNYKMVMASSSYMPEEIIITYNTSYVLVMLSKLNLISFTMHSSPSTAGARYSLL